MERPGSNPILTGLISHLILVFTSLVVLYPVLWVFKLALTPEQGFQSGINPFPEDFFTGNFSHLIELKDQDGNQLFGYWLFNSILISTVTAVFGVLLSTSAAYAFSRFTFPGKNLSLGSLLLTQMFPGTMMMIPLYILVDKLGLLDSKLGLIMVYSTTSIPFSAWMLKGYFDTIPRDLEEAAMMDGASRATIFFKIMLPLAKPAIAITALFSFMNAWNEFILASTFISNEMNYTLPVVLQSFVGARSTSWGIFAAGAIMVSTPIMILFFFLQKHMVSGLTSGSVKG